MDKLLRRLGLGGGSEAAVPEGLRVYAVGDIHGRSDLLRDLAGLVAEDLRARPAPRSLTVFLGDYGDRGPDTAGVIDRLARGDFPTPLVGLRGNHDAIFLDLLRGLTDMAYYEQLGGFETLRSYGIDPADFVWLRPDGQLARLEEAVPVAHRAWIEATLFSVEVGDYFFCHAGARPGVPLEQQSQEDLIWIREPFLRSTHDFGKMVVHGHTPVKTPEVRANGIDVDTKAYASGRLTALVLEGTGRRFLQT